MVRHWLGHPGFLCQNSLQTHSAECPDWLFLNCNEKKPRLSASDSCSILAQTGHASLPGCTEFPGVTKREALGKSAGTEPGCHLY